MSQPGRNRTGRVASPIKFAKALGRANLAADLHVGEGMNHFKMLETLGQRDGLLGRVARRQMGQA